MRNIVFAAMLFGSACAFGRYNGITFDVGYPSALMGQCKIQAIGSYFLEDDCLPGIEITLYAYASDGTEYSVGCGKYSKLQGTWESADDPSQSCVLNVPESGSYRVEAGLVDGFGYQFYSDTVTVSVSCL